ncbi:MAG TPA: hypothetical protein VFA52_03530 [Candidatus Paceibacterota bacterium]|nr:hypothetical protein [Candidatus Paceibacterota bacterium]
MIAAREQSYLSIRLPGGKNPELRRIEDRLNQPLIETRHQINEAQSTLEAWYEGRNGHKDAAYQLFGAFWRDHSKKEISVNERGLVAEVAFYAEGSSKAAVIFFRIEPQKAVMKNRKEILPEYNLLVRAQVRRMVDALRNTSDSYGNITKVV